MEVKIESLETYNMSNWEATHTFDTLNTINNKNNILKSISEYLNKGGQKNTIFIFSSSFKIKSNYSQYFTNGNKLSLNILDDLQNILYMGKIIPFEYNEDLANIQYIFNEYKSLNYIIANFEDNANRHNKFVSTDLIKYLKMVSEHNINTILKEMFTFYNEKLKQIYNKQTNANKELYIRTTNKLLQKCNKAQSRYIKFINKYKTNTNNTFMDKFYHFSRPIIGIYNKETRTIEIVNSDQMFEKGKHCKDELGLISITRNSPIKITVNSVGIMENIFSYLLLSYHNNKSFINTNTYRNDNELIEKIFNSSDLNINTLAKQLLDKIKEITNSKIVSLKQTIKNK